MNTILRTFYRFRFRNHTPINQIHKYWGGAPTDNGNTPVAYVEQDGMRQLSQYLINTVYRCSGKSILEIGCNAGRNLHYLFQNGYTNLAAVEINQGAIDFLRANYPELSGVKIYHSSIEDQIKQFRSDEFDIVFTTAVLYYIHYQSEWIFKEMARITGKYLITIENEWAITDWRHFPRNYKKIFTKYGMKQVFEEKLDDIPGLNKYFSGFVARVFTK